MADGPLGRLPPLQALGKSHSVDLDEPPDLLSSETSDDGEAFFREYEAREIERYRFEIQDSEAATKALARSFVLLQPGNHVCKQTLEGTTGFPHCKHGVDFGNKYSTLCQLMMARAKLQLIRDYTSRINAASMFVRDLELVTRAEYQTWYAVMHDTVTDTPATKLEYLSAICEDLRIHMNHWNSVKQLVHTDKWLRPLLPKLCLDMDPIRAKLYRLRDSAIWWVDRLIRVGLQVLAHCNPAHLTQDSLWSITRGLEDFNSIVASVKTDISPSSNLATVSSPHRHCINAQISIPNPVHTNSYKKLGESIKPIPFARVLHILANERSKYAAMMTQRFFTSGEEFMDLTLGNKMSQYSWDEELKGGAQRASRGTETSDYHSASGSHVSLSTALLRVGNLLAPDLSKQMSPVVDFARKEEEFAGNFLQIVCHSTSLLKRMPVASPCKVRTEGQNHPPKLGSITPKNRRRKKEVQVEEDTETHSELPPTGKIDLSRPESGNKRKTVSWGDAVDSSVKQQLTLKYLDLLWQCFGNNLYEFFHDHIWGGIDQTRGQLGHVTFCGDVTIMVLIRMMQQVCLKDMFPNGAVKSLNLVSSRLHGSTAWATWDSALCSAVASRVTDKCHPIPLANGDYSTKTGHLVREAYQPLLSVLSALQLDNPGGDKAQGPNGMVPTKTSQLTLLLPTLQRLELTCDVAAKWCRTKCDQFLASWAVGSFLLVTQSDLKLLADETKQVLYMSQAACTSGNYGNSQIEKQMQAQLGHIWQRLNNRNAQLQTLCGNSVKLFSQQCNQLAQEYFEDSMPVGKIWRKKSNQEMPSEVSPYAQQAMDMLLEPVIAGVSKLKATAQIGAVSMAVVAMCEAWTSYILKQKVKFSVYGAHQLNLDFMYVRTWLQNYLQNEEVRQSILALDVFKYLSGAIELLKRQPHGKTENRTGHTRLREETSMCCEFSISTSDHRGSISSGAAPLSDSEFSSEHELQENPTTISDIDIDNYKMPNMEQWLALRVHGGARNWKLPSCFTASPNET